MSKLGCCTLQLVLVFVSTTARAQVPDVANAQVETPSATAATPSGPRRDASDPVETPRATAPSDDDAYMDFSLHVPPRPRPHLARAVLAEFGLGVLGIGLGTGITMGLFAAIFWRSPGALVWGSLVVGGIFTFALADAGIYAGGDLTGGRGSSSWTALGILLGAGVGTALGLGVVNGLARPANGGFSDAAVLATTFAMPTLALVGGIVAYELSDRAERRRQERRLALVPVAAPTQHGVSLGLAGRF